MQLIFCLLWNIKDVNQKLFEDIIFYTMKVDGDQGLSSFVTNKKQMKAFTFDLPYK